VAGTKDGDGVGVSSGTKDDVEVSGGIVKDGVAVSFSSIIEMQQTQLPKRTLKRIVWHAISLTSSPYKAELESAKKLKQTKPKQKTSAKKKLKLEQTTAEEKKTAPSCRVVKNKKKNVKGKSANKN